MSNLFIVSLVFVASLFSNNARAAVGDDLIYNALKVPVVSDILRYSKTVGGLQCFYNDDRDRFNCFLALDLSANPSAIYAALNVPESAAVSVNQKVLIKSIGGLTCVKTFIATPSSVAYRGSVATNVSCSLK